MRVSGLLHYGLQVPDLDQGRGFYSDFGLDVAERSTTLAVRCNGRAQDQTLLTEGPDKRLHHVAFAVPVGGLTQMQRHLETMEDVVLEDSPGADFEGGLWFRDPDGNLVNLREQELVPPRDVEPVLLNMAGNYQRIDKARWLDASAPAAPRRLGHMLIFSSDNNRSQEFYSRTLGLRLSDRIPGIATFMNSGPGDHHVFGFVQSSHSGLHHSSWEVSSFDEMAMGARIMADKGHTMGWGLGRHSLGSNLFHYVRDPWGSWIEYFSDIDQITEEWKPTDYDTAPAVWCPMMPGEFLENHEAKPE
jgi:catechol 2,3-dioxygenase-like lactoylglutathione lyase family enzyme